MIAPMGLLAGIVFGLFPSAHAHPGAAADRPVSHVVWAGALATAIAKLPYLGHGDQGLAANIPIALLFAACGGVVTLACHAISRRWRRA